MAKKIMESLMRLKSANFNLLVRKHFLHSLPDTNQNLSILLKRRINRCCYSKTIFSLISGTDDDLSVVEFDDIPNAWYWNFCVHSHNRFCLEDEQDNIFLYNLTTREFAQLPPSIIIPPFTRRSFEYSYLEDFTPVVAFGYDHKSNEFKVFRSAMFDFNQRVEIYDLSSNQWREIPNSLDDDHIVNRYHMYDVSKGVYYFTGKSMKDESMSMLSFSMSTETFDWTPLPMIGRPSASLYSYRMGIWNGSIVMLILYYTAGRFSLEIWVMEEEEGGGVSWSKAFTIDDDFVSEIIKKPLQFLNSDQLLMIANDGQLVSYNVKTKELKNLSRLPGTIGGYVFEDHN